MKRNSYESSRRDASRRARALATTKKTLPTLVLLAAAAAGAAGCTGVYSAPETGSSSNDSERGAQAARDVPRVSELIRMATPLPDRACELSRRAGSTRHQDGVWCGAALRANAGAARRDAADAVDPATMYVCAEGRTYAKQRCATTCRSGRAVAGINLSDQSVLLRHDRCDRARQMIIIGLEQQRLRYCDGDKGGREIEHGVSTGAPGYETWNPMIASGAGSVSDGVYEFYVGDKYMMRRMISPYGADDDYDARIPWSMNLRTGRGLRTYQYLHASGACTYCGRPSASGHGVSHGCINQAHPDARALYLLTPTSTVVRLVRRLPQRGCFTCRSATLGRDVESNGCVQNSARRWYVCAAGRWYNLPASQLDARCVSRFPYGG